MKTSCGCSGYHWHPGKGHAHKHDEGHHGTPWGKPARVILVGLDVTSSDIDGPDLSLLLQQSIRNLEKKQ